MTRNKELYLHIALSMALTLVSGLLFFYLEFRLTGTRIFST